MNKEKLDHAIVIIMIATAVLTFVAGCLFIALQAAAPPQKAAEPTARPTALIEANALTTKKELEPDATAWLKPLSHPVTDERNHVLNVAAIDNKPLVLYFFSSWCSDCDVYTQTLPAIATTVESQGAKLILVCRLGIRDETVQSAKAYLEQNKITLDCYYDQDAQLYYSLGLKQVPSLVFLNSEGVPVHAFSRTLSPDEAKAWASYAANGAAAQTAAFIKAELIDQDGGIATAYTVDQMGRLTKQDIYMAEAQGLMMMYAANVSDKALFDQLYGFVESTLSSGGLSIWQKSPDADNVNATLDDLRILGALFRADAQWGGYDDAIALRSNALYTNAVRHGRLTDFAALNGRSFSDTLTLCYIDLDVLKALSAYDARWQDVYEDAEHILLSGMISDAFPLYHPRYDDTLNRYTGTEIHTAEALVTVLNLARAGKCDVKTLDYLEALLDAGAIYARYNLRGEPISGYTYDSTAVYALAAMIGHAADRPSLALKALGMMEQQRIASGTALDGSYGRQGTLYTFDDLMALTALTALGL